ncbi:unnamed protein product [marine sediment metagenome]|uniref:Peptidase M15A C-terminal domain-containing protein n=1 Tax=marine sediment metagenome TaxID=412755 RepID=X1G657_9ZZZZ
MSKLKDFGCKCGCKKNGFSENFFDAVYFVEEILPFKPKWTSGFRCTKHNKKVGGSPTSSHPKGVAVDGIYSTPTELGFLIKAIVTVCIIKNLPLRIGIYNGRIHWDIDITKTNPCTWR